MSKPVAKILDRSDLPEYITAIVVIIISLGLYAFVKLTGEVADGDTTGFDRQLLLMLRNPADLADPVGPVWLEVIVRDLTSLGGGQ
jgi:undecaprenyl-diphosphatase